MFFFIVLAVNSPLFHYLQIFPIPPTQLSGGVPHELIRKPSPQMARPIAEAMWVTLTEGSLLYWQAAEEVTTETARWRVLGQIALVQPLDLQEVVEKPQSEQQELMEGQQSGLRDRLTN